MRPKGMEDFGRIQCQKSKESSSRGKGKRRVFFCKGTVGVKVIPTSFLKVEGRGMLVGAKDRGERQIKELVDDQNPGPEAPPRSRKEQERREQRIYQGRSDCQRSDVEGWMCQCH